MKPATLTDAMEETLRELRKINQRMELACDEIERMAQDFGVETAHILYGVELHLALRARKKGTPPEGSPQD